MLKVGWWLRPSRNALGPCCRNEAIHALCKAYVKGRHGFRKHCCTDRPVHGQPSLACDLPRTDEIRARSAGRLSTQDVRWVGGAEAVRAQGWEFAASYIAVKDVLVPADLLQLAPGQKQTGGTGIHTATAHGSGLPISWNVGIVLFLHARIS